MFDGFGGFLDFKLVGDLTSASCVKRYGGNPVLSPKDIPYDSAMVFNVSVWKETGRYTMVFRNDYFYGEQTCDRHPDDTHFGLAHSADGIRWVVEPEPIFQYKTKGIRRVYDPRVTSIEGRYYLTCCADTVEGPRAATFVSDDLRSFELIDLALPASRNTLLFPEKINGKYYRMERPFSGDWVEGFAQVTGKWLGRPAQTWITSSPDLIHWGDTKLLLTLEHMPYANVKTGPGAIPIKTDKGWLLLTHGVDFDPARGKNGWEWEWKMRYCGGVALLDLDDPTRLIGASREPLLVPETDYETRGGFRNNVIFPTAGVLEDDGMVKIYYGAADTTTCLAEAKLDDLLALCEPV